MAYMIYDFFRVTGAHDTVLDYADVFSSTLRTDDVQEFDTRWDAILLSMTKIPTDDVLESLYKLRIRESNQRKTVLELYDMEIHQKISMPNCQKLKTMVKRSIDQKLRITKFRRQERENCDRKEQWLRYCYQWKAKGQWSRGDQSSFRHESHDREKPTPEAAPPSEPPTPRGRSASRKRASGAGVHLRRPIDSRAKTS